MMHIDDGALRRYCDEADSLDDGRRAHLADCPACGARLSEIREDAAHVADAFAVTTDERSRADVWPLVRERLAMARRPVSYGPWLAAAAAAAVGALFAFTPVGTL